MEYLQYYRRIKRWWVSCTYVLNLVISGIPSILKASEPKTSTPIIVLNLVISGIPSILKSVRATGNDVRF